MRRHRMLVLSICLFFAVVRTSNAEEKEKPLTIEQAIAIVDRPAFGFANMSPFKLQTHYRLTGLLYQSRYAYEAKHDDAWIACMHDEKRSMYARLCAAYFLLDQPGEARTFLETQLKSKNLRYRYNAAEVVHLHANLAPKKEWDVGVLIGLLGDGSIDGSGVHTSPAGEYPEGDRDDIMSTPIDDICWSLGLMKEKKAVPALISVLQRRPPTGGAAFALGETGDQRAIPALMKVLQDGSGYEDREVTALGKLKCKEAVPILISRLGNPRTTFNDLDQLETRSILEALLAIGDSRAIAPIEKYLQGTYPVRSKAVARRVLVQLQSPDPVKALLELFDAETYEPERSDIIHDLVKHPDDRVVGKLATIARTSDSAFLRRQAIFGLQNIGNRSSLLVLASLLDLTFPKNLRAEWGWKMPPDFERYFPETIEQSLKDCTKQDFGRDRRKWEEWITKNVELNRPPEARAGQ